MRFVISLMLLLFMSTQSFATNTSGKKIDIQEARRILLSEEHYEILGVNQNATESEIKLAHKKLVGKYFPDHFSSDPALHKLADAVTKKINGSRIELMDPEKRRKYDYKLRSHSTAGPKATETKWQPQDFSGKKSYANSKHNDSDWKPYEFDDLKKSSSTKQPYEKSQQSKEQNDSEASNETRASSENGRNRKRSERQKPLINRRTFEAIKYYKSTQGCSEEVYKKIVDVFL
ncbi:MAG: J domain-containing protein [Bdellovibrio sp.]